MVVLPYEVNRIAQAVRRWAERNRLQLGCSYPDLCGLCAIASAELYRRLKRYDSSLKVELAYAEDMLCGHFGHVFVIFNGDTIIDLTATQFEGDYASVEVRKLRSCNSWYWTPINRFDDDESLHEFQVETDWASWQQANTHIIEKKIQRKSNGTRKANTQ